MKSFLDGCTITYHYDWRIWTYMSKWEMAKTIALLALLLGDLMLLVAYFLVGFGVLEW